MEGTVCHETCQSHGYGQSHIHAFCSHKPEDQEAYHYKWRTRHFAYQEQASILQW
jgi:hypothetical protein